MVRLYVNVQFQVKPLSTGISSSRTKKKIFQKCLHGPPKVCTKLGVSFYIRARLKNAKTSPSADMVRLYVNVQFQVKPLSTGTSSSQTKKKFPQKY